jgi:acetylornithine deacetylase/succinyl-diaminopimelate desuccinylase-like protein
MQRLVLAAIVMAMMGSGAWAAPATHPQADAQALDLAEKAIALRSVRGPGNQAPQVAELYKAALVAGGFALDEVTITPVDDTAYLIARWRGSDPKLEPLVISGHMDVVEARPADWRRDPFKPVVENGYLFGRGATDMKLDGTIAIASLIEMRREGYRPRRDIVIEFSGDEETTMKTSAMIADKLANAEMVLNMDGSGGVLNEQTGAPELFTWEGAEKTYADFQLTVTNPGGHSSAPRRENAIDQLAAALVRIGKYQFTPELNDLTRAYFVQAARYEEPKIGAAMRAFAADPTDKAAIETLTDNPATVGKIGTTCVVTMISGGHALNALPQRATANINCRIFPGHPPAAIMAELQKVADEPAVSFKDVSEGSVATPASPLRPDLVAAVNKALASAYPGVPVFPAQSSGASDSMWFRHHGVPSYGISPLFMKPSENFSHGLNERTPIADIPPAITYCISLFTSLSS